MVELEIRREEHVLYNTYIFLNVISDQNDSVSPLRLSQRVKHL